jgi:hypothetical protein
VAAANAGQATVCSLASSVRLSRLPPRLGDGATKPAAASLRPLLDREPVAAKDYRGHRAVVLLTLAFAPVKRAIADLRLGIRRGGRMSRTRIAPRGSRANSVCPHYAHNQVMSCDVVRTRQGYNLQVCWPAVPDP